MAKKINITGKAAKRIEVTGKPLPRIEHAEFAAALGAEPCGQPISGDLDPISLGELGNELIKRLRSTGGRPALADATERCKVPVSAEDMAALELIIGAVESETGMKPSVGQLASVILRLQLNALKAVPQPVSSLEISKRQMENGISKSVLQQMIEEQISPLREEVRRLETELHAVCAGNK